jgi:hypothetical protein
MNPGVFDSRELRKRGVEVNMWNFRELGKKAMCCGLENEQVIKIKFEYRIKQKFCWIFFQREKLVKL